MYSSPKESSLSHIISRLNEFDDALQHKIKPTIEGVVTRIVGQTIEVSGLRCEIGTRCQAITRDNSRFDLEVVGFEKNTMYLAPVTHLSGLSPGARVRAKNKKMSIAVSDELLGCVLDGDGEIIQGMSSHTNDQKMQIFGEYINPLTRSPIKTPIDVGIRSINSLLTIGRGQRIGLFAGSGVGKSVLMGMMTKYTDADVIVVGLIGERGREVREFIEEILGQDGLKRAVVVASPASDSPLKRIHAAYIATTIAEYYRAQGKNVLLLMDSLTRFAQAQREIALSIGEPPVNKGFPPSVFSKIPQLVERAGNLSSGMGSITAFYTVLMEGDDKNDPIADSARAILDGHIVLSRKMAESGIYPSIDIEASISRTMNNVITDEHKNRAIRFKQLYSCYEENKDFITIGALGDQRDKLLTAAMEKIEDMLAFIKQDINECADFTSSVSKLELIVDEKPQEQTQ